MKQLVMTVAFTLIFGLAALAQNPSPSDPQSSTSPSAQPSQSTSETSSQSQTAEPSSSQKETKLKGCLQSENGKYILQEKNGKTVELTGQDLSAHVGQTVKVEGTRSAASESLPAGTGQPSAGSSNEQFTVTKIDKVSDTCEMGKSK
jgi:hypothetical protein